MDLTDYPLLSHTAFDHLRKAILLSIQLGVGADHFININVVAKHLIQCPQIASNVDAVEASQVTVKPVQPQQRMVGLLLP